MEHQISRIDPLQAGKVAAALYFIFGAVAIPIALIGGLSSSEPGVAVLAILLPFIYALIGFIFIPVFCWVYNQVADRIGGLIITLNQPLEESIEDSQDQEF